jgi:hypothetical protein
MKRNSIFLNLFILCVLSSCGYKMITVTDINGKKFKERQYSNSERGERYVNKLAYKRIYKKQDYSRFSGRIISDTIRESVFVQYDSIVRIYLNEDNNNKLYAPIFSSGLLYPKMIFCATDSLCKPLINYEDTIIKDTSKNTIIRYGNPVIMEDAIYDSGTSAVKLGNLEYHYAIPEKVDRFGYRGTSVNVRNISELKYLETVHKKVFKVEFSTWSSIGYSDGITDYYYYLEIENATLNRNVDLNSFVKGGKVTFFKFEYSTHEI